MDLRAGGLDPPQIVGTHAFDAKAICVGFRKDNRLIGEGDLAMEAGAQGGLVLHALGDWFRGTTSLPTPLLHAQRTVAKAAHKRRARTPGVGPNRPGPDVSTVRALSLFMVSFRPSVFVIAKRAQMCLVSSDKGRGSASYRPLG